MLQHTVYKTHPLESCQRLNYSVRTIFQLLSGLIMKWAIPNEANLKFQQGHINPKKQIQEIYLEMLTKNDR